MHLHNAANLSEMVNSSWNLQKIYSYMMISSEIKVN